MKNIFPLLTAGLLCAGCVFTQDIDTGKLELPALQSDDYIVEYQGYISHGPQKYHCPFDSNNDEHRKIVDEWFKKSEEYNFKGQKKKKYLEYIKCWTISDVIKRETAKENNLNYLEFFDIHQFMDWFMTQGVKENEDTYLEHRD